MFVLLAIGVFSMVQSATDAEYEREKKRMDAEFEQLKKQAEDEFNRKSGRPFK